MNICRTKGLPLIPLTLTRVEKHGHMTTKVTLVQLASVYSMYAGTLMTVPRLGLRPSNN